MWGSECQWRVSWTGDYLPSSLFCPFLHLPVPIRPRRDLERWKEEEKIRIGVMVLFGRLLDGRTGRQSGFMRQFTNKLGIIERTHGGRGITYHEESVICMRLKEGLRTRSRDIRGTINRDFCPNSPVKERSSCRTRFRTSRTIQDP